MITSQRRMESAAGQLDDLRTALADGSRALMTDGDLRQGRSHFEQAYQLAERAADGEAMALAALGLAGLWLHEHRTVTGAVQLEVRLQHALSLLDEHAPLALRIRVRLAGERDYARGEHAAILAVLSEARAACDPVLAAEALSMAHHCLLGPDHVTQRQELAGELIRQSVRTQRRGDMLMGLLWQTVDAYSQGDPHAGRLLAELRAHLDQRNHRAVGFVVNAVEVMLAIRAGQLNEAESLADTCARNGALAGDADAAWWHIAQLVTIRWYQGRLVELLPMLLDLVHSADLSAVDNSALAALAVAAAQGGDRRTAASSLAALCGEDLSRLPRSSSWLAAMNGIVETASLLQDADVSARAYELLSPYAQLPMVGGLGIVCFGSTHHALGVAALTCGYADKAIDHLRAAVRHNLALAHWPAVVASRQRLAQAHALRRLPDDAGTGRIELDTAATEAAALGIPVLHSTAARLTGTSAASAGCARAGRNWRLTLGNRSVLVEHSIGVLHLAVLIANPRQEIPAADLVAGLTVLSSAAIGGAAQPVLDHAAVCDYRHRIEQLDAELDELESAGDDGQAARARAERDWLAAELVSAAGLGGRPRSFSDQPERARVAVGKAIRRAVIRISATDPVIGEHLRQAVHTGMRCSYWPT